MMKYLEDRNKVLVFFFVLAQKNVYNAVTYTEWPSGVYVYVCVYIYKP